MTGQQLKQMEAILAEKMPGWTVARGGILTKDPVKGIKQVVCNMNGHLPNKIIVFDFDKMIIVNNI